MSTDALQRGRPRAGWFLTERSARPLGAPGGGRRRGNGWRPVRVEFLDGAAVDPEPEEGLLRLAVLGEGGIAGGAVEGLAHGRQRIAHLVAAAWLSLLDDLPQDRRAVVGVGLEEAGRAVVRRVVVVDELLGGGPLALREEAVDEDRALHVLGRAHPLVDQLGVVPEV